MFDLRVYIHAPADVRLARRIRRDVLVNHQDWSLAETLDYYLSYARPLHEEFMWPRRACAQVL